MYMLPQRPHFRPLAIGLLLISSSVGLWLLSLTFFTHAMPVAHAQEVPTGDGTFVVQSLDDVPPTAEDPVCAVDCTLRDAVRAANAMTGANTIVFADGLAGEIVLIDSMSINDDVIVDGPGSDVITVTLPGRPSTSDRRHFYVNSYTVTLRGLTLQSSGTRYGGGIDNEGNLTLEDIVISKVDLDGYGGAIVNYATLTITDSVLSDNTSNHGGGIYNFSGSVAIVNSRISGSNADHAGTAIYNDAGIITMTGATIAGNLTSIAVVNEDGQITVDQSTFENNVVAALLTEGLSSTLSISGSHFLGNDLGIQNSEGGGEGGKVTVTASTFEGPAFFNQNDGSVLLVDSLLTGSDDSPGGVSVLNRSAEFTMLNSTVAETFGGIVNEQGGHVLIEQSTISNNRARDNNPGNQCASIQNRNTAFSPDIPTTMTIRNSTISGNHAVRFGGGLCVTSSAAGGSKVTVINSTIANNRALNPPDEEGGGGIYIWGGDLTLVNSIVAENYRGEANVLDNLFQRPDFPGTVTTQGVNLSDTQPAGFGTDDLVNVPPLLGPLADNGGATHTHALLAGSPALDAADDDLCPAIDQRGEPRPANGDDDPAAVCDIGAYEAQSVPEPDPDPEVENGIFLPFVLSDS